MAYTQNLVLVCSGKDTQYAANLGLPVLHLCLGISSAGALQHLQLSTTNQKRFIGITELPENVSPGIANRVADDIAFEAKRMDALGVFADFERDTAACQAVIAATEKALFKENIPFFVPFSSGKFTEHAILTVDTAISGGSLVERISSLQGRYGSHRIAALLRMISSDFVLPSSSPYGKTLSTEERNALLEKTGSQTFFSRELCAKYFTYTDEENNAHFVLYDDSSTLEAKLAQLSGCGVQTVFSLFPDAKELIMQS